jgi:hypothetical protein
MMKKLLLILAIALVSLQAFSQIKFGLKVAAATTTVPSYDVSSGNTNIEEVKNSSWGWQAGAFLRISLTSLYIQPEVLFASNSYDYTVTTATVDEIVSQKFNRLSIPILVGLKLGPIRVNAGPAASIQIGSPENLVDDPNFEDMYKGALWGYQAGVGIDLFNRLTLDARYAGGLGDKTGETVAIGGQDFKLDYGQQSFILSVGIIF